jgi:hypothetical protein
MKVIVTHLKAPWPPGTQPGDTIELDGDVLPGWAVGKCTPATAGGDTERTFVVSPTTDAAAKKAKAAK